MSTMLEVTFAPVEFEALPNRDLSQTACVVFDVLRATSSMVSALAAGAEAIQPVAGIQEALAAHQASPGSLLAGERDGLRIRGDLTGAIDFHLGNSPREFVRNTVSGKTIIMTTTNGTRALRSATKAHAVFVSCFLNLTATAHHLQERQFSELLLICGGTFEQMAYEDVLAAGALCRLLSKSYGAGQVADSALIARTLFEHSAADLTLALSRSRNGQRLLSRPELCDDVAYCAQLDCIGIVAEMDAKGLVRCVD